MTFGASARVREPNPQSRAGQISFWTSRLFIGVAVLTVLGLAASFSSTVYLALAKDQPPYKEFMQHAGFMLGGLALVVAMQIIFQAFAPARRWLKYLIPFAFFISLVLVALVRFSPLGISEFGARRWLHLGGLTFQPSELLKVTLILYLAQLLCWWRRPATELALAANQRAGQDGAGESEDSGTLGSWMSRQLGSSFRLQREGRPVVPEMPRRCLFFILVAAGLTAIQPDLGSTGVILGISVVTLLLAQVRFRDFALLFGTLILSGVLVVAFAPGFYDYAHKRLATWINPTADNDSTAYQITQSRGALAVAGLWGKGYLKGEQKINRLPLSTKDFVYPVMVEELGLIGGIAILATFMYLGFVGIQLGLSCRDPFNQTAIAALGLAVTLQALVNIGTTLGTLPLSGLTLPFLSGGGTSLILSYFCIGLMAALGRSEATLLRRDEARPVRVLNRGQSG